MWGTLSDERMGLSVTIAAGPHERSHSRVRVPWDSRPYFTVSDLGLPFSSPPTTRRVTVEVFDPRLHTAGINLSPFTKAEIQSQNYVTTDGQSVLISSTHLGLATRFFFVRELRVSWCGALSLTRERICHLQFLLVLASAVILGSEFRDFTASDSRLPTWRERSPYLYPPGTGWPSYNPRHWVPFPSPSTTSRTHKVRVKVTLRLTVGLSVSLGEEPHLGLMTRYLLLFDSYSLVFVGRPLW
jgi:hypothetical protein